MGVRIYWKAGQTKPGAKYDRLLTRRGESNSGRWPTIGLCHPCDESSLPRCWRNAANAGIHQTDTCGAPRRRSRQAAFQAHDRYQRGSKAGWTSPLIARPPRQRPFEA